MVETRLISIKALETELENVLYMTESTKAAVRAIIRKVPTVDALPLRCWVDDEVWVVGTKCLSDLYQDECNKKSIPECDFCPLDQEYIVFPRVVDSYLFSHIHGIAIDPNFVWGETVFKTQEEAEAALANMEGGASND